MPNPYPAIWQFLDNLNTRLQGEVTFTDPANQPGGGGGGSVNSVTAGDTSITIGGTLADPTVAVAALGVTQAKIAAGAVTDTEVNPANKDGLAAVYSLRTLGTGAQQAVAGNDSRLSDSRTPTGPAGGDLTGTYPSPTLAAAGGGAAGPIGSATVTPIVTVDAKGRVTALSSATISGVAPGGAAGGDLSGTYPSPTVAKLNGVAITNAPSTGQVLTATDATHAAWAAGGGGALTQSYIGYNTVGASTETVASPNYTTYFKQATVATAALVTSIDAYVKGNASNVQGIWAALLDDNAGAPGKILAIHAGQTSSSLPVLPALFTATSRWVASPIGCYVAAGTYWLGLIIGNAMSINYDTGGSDYTAANNVTWFNENSKGAAGTRNYSIRANLIS